MLHGSAVSQQMEILKKYVITVEQKQLFEVNNKKFVEKKKQNDEFFAALMDACNKKEIQMLQLQQFLRELAKEEKSREEAKSREAEKLKQQLALQAQNSTDSVRIEQLASSLFERLLQSIGELGNKFQHLSQRFQDMFATMESRLAEVDGRHQAATQDLDRTIERVLVQQMAQQFPRDYNIAPLQTNVLQAVQSIIHDPANAQLNDAQLQQRCIEAVGRITTPVLRSTPALSDIDEGTLPQQLISAMFTHPEVQEKLHAVRMIKQYKDDLVESLAAAKKVVNESQQHMEQRYAHLQSSAQQHSATPSLQHAHQLQMERDEFVLLYKMMDELSNRISHMIPDSLDHISEKIHQHFVNFKPRLTQ